MRATKSNNKFLRADRAVAATPIGTDTVTQVMRVKLDARDRPIILPTWRFVELNATTHANTKWVNS